MVYKNDIPKAADKKNESQLDLLNNFAAIKNLVDIDHETFGAGDEGEHKQLTLTNQTPAAPGANKVRLYSNTGELCLKKGIAGAEVNFTIDTGHTTPQGYENFPSGLIMNWGTIYMGSGTLTAAVALSQAITTLYGFSYGTRTTNPAITVAGNAVITAKTLTGGGANLSLTRGASADAVYFDFILIGK
jgi:hypothetical protein